MTGSDRIKLWLSLIIPALFSTAPPHTHDDAMISPMISRHCDLMVTGQTAYNFFFLPVQTPLDYEK